MTHLFTLIRSNLMKQTRRYSFFIIIGISIFLGFLCVPSQTARYEIFYMGGVRGVYNSAWLGVMGAMLPVILLWLPGFYLLRSQISEDRDLQIGQMIAASPISKYRYIYGKFTANFSVLMLLQIIFLIAIMIMQLIHQESTILSIIDYLEPLLLVTIPHLMTLAALTILFDVVPFLKGTLGNIFIFIIWLLMLTISIMKPGSHFDMFGLGVLLNAMHTAAKEIFPYLMGGTSFGYYPTTAANTATFFWDGMVWNQSFLLSRLVWIIAALTTTQVAVLIFNRFRETTPINSSTAMQHHHQPNKAPSNRLTSIPKLSAVKKSSHMDLLQMLRGELKLILSGHSKWWYLLVLTIIALTPLTASKDSLRWLSLSMLLPMPIWAQMGNREKTFGTSAFVISSCSVFAKWLVCWLSGIITALLISIGIFALIIINAEWSYLIPWLVGIIFIPTLALTIGSITGSRKPFEGIFIALMYFGSINNLWKFDFLGLSSNNAAFYMTATVIIIGIRIMVHIFRFQK